MEAALQTNSAAGTTRDLRVESIRPLVSPALLLEQLPLPDAGADLVRRARREIVNVLNGQDDRLIAVVGPCSIHDCDAGLDYAQRLARTAREVEDEVLVVMRVYFEKPRTTVGWKGLLNDPHLDGSYAINDGLRLGRQMLLDVTSLGLPAGCEFLDPISPQFFTDIVSWGAIGARTTESQIHRQLASGLSMPVGFKNGTDGGVQIAIDALRAALYPHSFLGVTDLGLAGIVTTTGNPDCHLILRGGNSGPNYDATSVQQSLERLRAAGLPERLMVDASHGNSSKDYRKQPLVTASVAEQVASGTQGLVGVMIESFLAAGRQDMADGAALVYGQSITDACLDWDGTVPVLEELARAVRDRRRK